jgi:predicted transcriptional regulator
MTFFKSRFRQKLSEPPRNIVLGSLETRVMEILWALGGNSSVRDVCEKIETPRAYTTVMTTLERLFKKGLLSRQKSGRAFLYCPAVSREEWNRRRAGSLMDSFLNGPELSRELLVSTLLDAVGNHDAALLGELEKEIRARRKELLQQGAP